MKVNARKDGITLKLDTAEALALENLLGTLTGEAAQSLPGWYDRIADTLECEDYNLISGKTISHAVAEQVQAGKLPRIWRAEFKMYSDEA